MTGADNEGVSGAESYRQPLDAAHRHALSWLDGVRDRPIRPDSDVDDILAVVDRPLPVEGADATAVVDELAAAVGPGLMAMSSPRYYGFVIGGIYPAAIAADWLVSAWDQNTGSRQPTPGTAAVEEVAARWLVDLFGLPAGSGVGFVTGATSANLSALVVARDAVLRGHGHDPLLGIQSAPRIRLLAGGAVHTSVVLGGRIAGLGAPQTVGCDAQGRIDLDGLAAALSRATARRSWRCRPAMSTPARSTISPEPLRSRRMPARGSTSTVRSDCGPRRAQGSTTSSQDSKTPILGRPMRTRP